MELREFGLVKNMIIGDYKDMKRLIDYINEGFSNYKINFAQRYYHNPKDVEIEVKGPDAHFIIHAVNHGYMTWDKAMEQAEKDGYTLPTPEQMNVIFANKGYLKVMIRELDPNMYEFFLNRFRMFWTNEPVNDSSALAFAAHNGKFEEYKKTNEAYCIFVRTA